MRLSLFLPSLSLRPPLSPSCSSSPLTILQATLLLAVIPSEAPRSTTTTTALILIIAIQPCLRLFDAKTDARPMSPCKPYSEPSIIRIQSPNEVMNERRKCALRFCYQRASIHNEQGKTRHVPNIGVETSETKERTKQKEEEEKNRLTKNGKTGRPKCCVLAMREGRKRIKNVLVSNTNTCCWV